MCTIVSKPYALSTLHLYTVKWSVCFWWRRGESNPRPLNPTLASSNYVPRADKRVIRSCFVALARVGTDTPTVA